ncbi:chorismate synthase, partial [Priestia megaterium]|nr:chorismate synthase [Priestia megaterium]
ACTIEGLPCGVGEPMFDGLENRISQAVFAIPAVKGIEFGDGFKLSELKGSEARDEYVASDGKIALTSNHNGGILGGISTGEAVNFRVCIKPTPSISIPSKSVSYSRGEN